MARTAGVSKDQKEAQFHRGSWPGPNAFFFLSSPFPGPITYHQFKHDLKMRSKSLPPLILYPSNI
jgi:hypothetical protein